MSAAANSRRDEKRPAAVDVKASREREVKGRDAERDERSDAEYMGHKDGVSAHWSPAESRPQYRFGTNCANGIITYAEAFSTGFRSRGYTDTRM